MTADFEQATAEKLRCQREADATQATIQLANRLVNGLASENVRWAEAVAEYEKFLIFSDFIKCFNCFIFKIYATGHNFAW